MTNKKVTRTLAAILMSATVVASAPAASLTAPVVAEAAINADSAQLVDIFQGMTTSISSDETHFEEKTFKFYNKSEAVIRLAVTSEDSSVSTTVSIRRKVNGIYVNVDGEKIDGSVNPKYTYYSLPASKDPYLLCLKGPYGQENIGITATKVSDISNHLTSAKSIGLSKLVSGQIYTKDDVDCFKFNSGKFNLIKITATSGSWASNDYSIYKNTSGSKAALVSKFRYNSLRADTLTSNYIKVKPNTNYYIKTTVWNALWNGESREYSFKLEGYMDVSDSAKTAKMVKMGKLVNGKVECKDDDDYYIFKATKSGTVKLTSSASNAFASDIEVYRKGSASKLFEGGISTSGTQAKFKVKKNNYYIVKVIGHSSNTTYSFKVK